MKSILTKLPSLLAIAAILSLSSCLEKEIKELLTVDTPIEINKTFSVNIDENDPKSFEDKETIDAKVEGVEITDVTIDKLMLSFANVNAASGAELEFTIEGSNAPILASIGELAALDGQEIDLTSTAGSMLDTYEEFLKNNPEAVLVVSGTVDEVPVSFDMELDMVITVTGKPE